MREKKRPLVWWIGTSLIIVGVAGCSTVRPPREEIATAELAVSEASKSKAPQYAGQEFRTATDKLNRAKRAMDNRDYTEARRLAEQALVDAQLAQSQARSEDARLRAREVREGVETLRREIERRS